MPWIFLASGFRVSSQVMLVLYQAVICGILLLNGRRRVWRRVRRIQATAPQLLDPSCYVVGSRRVPSRCQSQIHRMFSRILSLILSLLFDTVKVMKLGMSDSVETKGTTRISLNHSLDHKTRANHRTATRMTRPSSFAHVTSSRLDGRSG